LKNFINKIPVSAWLTLLLSALCAFVFWDFLTFQKLYLFKDIGSDTLNLFYPHLLHITDYLQTEGIPKWSFNQGIGQNITNSGIDNPFNWPFYWLGKENLAYAIIYVEVSKIILCGVMTYHWLRLLINSKTAAVWGGLSFAFSGYVIVGSSWYVHSYFCLTTVLLLLAFELGYQRKNWLLMPIAAFLAFGLNALFTAQFMLIYLLFRLYINEDFKIASFWVVAKKAIPYALLGVLFKAPFLGSLFSRIFDSHRMLSNNSVGFTWVESFHYYLTLILRFTGNDWQGNGSLYTGWANYLEAPLFYVGLPTIALAVLIFFVENRHLRNAFGVLFAFWILLLTIPFLRHAFYWFSGDYFKNALSCFVPLTLIMAAAYALKEIYEGKITKTFQLVIILLFGSTLIITSLVGHYLYYSQSLDWYQFITIYSIPVMLVFLFLTNTNSKFYIYPVCLFLVVNLAVTAYYTINERDALTTAEFTERKGYNDYTNEALDFLHQSDTSFYRVQKKYPSTWAVNSSLNDAKVFNFFGTSAYSSFNQSSYINFLIEMGLVNPNKAANLKWVSGLGNRDDIADLLGVKYKLYKAPFKNDSLPKLRTLGDITIYENPYAKPLGFTIQHYISLDDFEKLNQQQKDCAINKTIIADESNTTNGLKKLSETEMCLWQIKYFQTPEDLKLVSFSQNKITFMGSTFGGMFFTSIPYDNGWKAEIVEDGQNKSVETQKVNFGFIGIPVTNKTTALHLSFTPPFYKLGWILAIAALAIYGLLIANFYRSRKRSLI